MSVPSFVPLAIPPLPPGWTDHIAPGGQTYYYNARTRESTYIRPIPSFHSLASFPAEKTTTVKKEKPLIKKQIPTTDWLHVTTNEGNIFYFNKEKKESTWIVPDEIKDNVVAMELQEKEQQEKALEAMLLKATKAEEARKAEVERIKSEMKGTIKRKADEETPMDEFVIAKKAKVDQEESEDDSEEEDEEEEWQREAAAQLAAEAEEERKRQEEAEEERKREEREKLEKEKEEAQRLQTTSLINMPKKVDLSIDEAKALFKTLLKEKDVNPLHPWDTSLPMFINDPRYVLLPSVAARKEAFDEYCRDRARELRESAVKKVKQTSDPKQDYEDLLDKEVISTRTTWPDFRKIWKKDRRFYGWGRDDREREKRFRDYLKELGEKKRIAAKKAEADFFFLLKEHGSEISHDPIWKSIKKKLFNDPRYDAVGSSSLREELFNTYLKGNVTLLSGDKSEAKAPTTSLSKEQRKERAVREREVKVKADLNRVEMNIERSRMGINLEEGERDYRSMLVDAIRDPQMTWDDALPQLKTDPRFRNSPLSPNQQLLLFHNHIAYLRQKQMVNLQNLFQSHSPTLAKPFSDLPVEFLLKSSPVTNLGLDVHHLEEEYERWQRERFMNARKAFDEMLTENSFVEFWGRLRKLGGEGVEGGVKADELGDDDEGEGGGGKVDMKVLAKSVDLGDMEKVLRNDKRYIMFDHIPDQRERWLRDYLTNLSAPKLSVHVPS